MSQPHMLLLCGDRRGAGGVDITDHDCLVGFFAPDYFFKSDHGLAHLLRMGPGSNAQIDIGVRNSQGLEKQCGHLVVTMLAGTH